MMARRNEQHQLGGWRRGKSTKSWISKWFRIYRNRRNLLMLLAFIAIVPPLFFHFRLQQMQNHNSCDWLINPPLVCAHGGDSTRGLPNTVVRVMTKHAKKAYDDCGPVIDPIAAYRSALQSQVDCIEIDVSRSSDGVLFALHDRDLQRISGNHTSRVGYFSAIEISLFKREEGVNPFFKYFPLLYMSDTPWYLIDTIYELSRALQSPENLDDQKVLTMEDALMFVLGSVRQVIVDAKVGPPSYEKGLAENILTAVQKTHCANCVVWAKRDTLVRDIIRLSPNTSVGYIVMKDLSTGARSNLLRMKSAGVVGIYHPLIVENVVKILHGRNKKIYAWTVDDVNAMQNLLSKGVDAIITNNPTILKSLMEQTRVQCLQEGFSLP